MIRLIKPYISFAEVETEFREIFESGWFTKGKYCDAFQQAICQYTGAKYSFLATSATTALWVSLKVAGVKSGDEVIVSDFSFPATVNVVEDIGAIPVFADVDLKTFNMPIESLRQSITEKTKAVIFVDAFGNPSGLEELANLCKEKNIFLIEDAACALGSSVNGKKCGNIADLTCFSLHPRKLLTAGEGGIITTNNDSLAEILAVKLNHGAIERDSGLDFVECGYNFRLPELQSVMGLKQLLKIDSIVAERNKTRQSYIECLLPKGFIPQQFYENVVSNVQSVIFVVPDGLDRNSLIHFLRDKGVESTIGTYSLSNLTYYKGKYQSEQGNSLFLQERTLTLPCYDGVNLNMVCEAIDDFS